MRKLTLFGGGVILLLFAVGVGAWKSAPIREKLTGVTAYFFQAADSTITVSSGSYLDIETKGTHAADIWTCSEDKKNCATAIPVDSLVWGSRIVIKKKPDDYLITIQPGWSLDIQPHNVQVKPDNTDGKLHFLTNGSDYWNRHPSGQSKLRRHSNTAPTNPIRTATVTASGGSNPVKVSLELCSPNESPCDISICAGYYCR